MHPSSLPMLEEGAPQTASWKPRAADGIELRIPSAKANEGSVFEADPPLRHSPTDMEPAPPATPRPPTPGALKGSDQCSGARLQVIPDLSWRLETAFHSPPTATRYRATIEGLTLPACFFTASQNLVLNPFGLLLLRLGSVCPSHGAIDVADPLSSSLASRSRLALWPPLPFGVLRPLWLEAFSPTTTRKAPLGTQPDFPSLPAGVPFY
jgi:hypothetical protein